MRRKIAFLNIVIVVLLLLSLLPESVAQAQGNIQAAAEGYFSEGTKNIKVTDLFDNLHDGDESNDPFIVDARKPEDYAKGHIPGAVNIGPKVAFSADNLAKFPKDKQIVVYCYTGQTSSQMVAALRMLGYDAYNLLFGMPAWAMVEGVAVQPFNAETHSQGYTVETEPHEAAETYDLPEPLGGDDVAAAAEEYFSGGTKNIKVTDLFDNLHDGDETNDPFIIDLRKPEDYALGHIPGAVNFSVKSLFSVDNLKKLPPDRQIVAYCYTGQTSSQAVAALRMLGYDAYNLLFGMPAWAMVEDVSVQPFNAEVHSQGYPVETGEAKAEEAAPAEAKPEAEMGECDFAAAFDSFLAEKGGSFFTTAEALFDNLHDGDESNDPFIVDVRKPEHYEAGHIPGAINIPWTQIAKEENLAKFPKDKQIVVYCYTGQTGAVAATVLNILGYDAVNLKYGMSSWTLNEKANPVHFNPEKDSHDYAFEGSAAE